MIARKLLVVASLAAIPLAGQARQDKAVEPYPNAGKAPAIKPPDQALRKEIEDSLRTLQTRRNEPTLSKVPDGVWVDVEVYAKAAEWVLRHGEFFNDTAKQTAAVLDDGLSRAYKLATGKAPWRFKPGRTVVRGYRSKVDGSVQPYAVTLPSDYGKDTSKKWRLDVVLHGRGADLTEVKFIYQHHDKPAKDQPFVQIDIYGRGNNAYRWAGETDVFEAIEAFRWSEGYAGRGDLLDPKRVVLRGFSMGGAGSWHLGLHHPDEWAVIGPGAGFTTTHGYAPVPDNLPDYVEKCLHIYDAVDYAENAAMVPVVAYAGEKDKQLQAAKNIEARLKPMNIAMTLLVAPNTEHKLTPEYAQKAEAEFAKYAGPGKGRPKDPDHIRFATYTTKYSGSDWVVIRGLDRHYALARVRAHLTPKGFAAETSNVRKLDLMVPSKRLTWREHVIEIDGDVVTVPGIVTTIFLIQVNGHWVHRRYEAGPDGRPAKDEVVEKRFELQGPIDDAFTDAFVCVRGTGTPWHAAVGDRAEAELACFATEWDKYLRGALPIKDDTAVTAEDIRTKNVILFGDPASNSLIAKVLPKLPLIWTKESITLNGVSASSADHMPVLIQPNPLNPDKYVVLNSGHTFHADAFRGTNALLFPRLGDFALLKLAPTAKDAHATEIVTAGLFDEFWQPPKK